MKSKDLIPLLNELEVIRDYDVDINNPLNVELFKMFLRSYNIHEDCTGVLCDDCIFNIQNRRHNLCIISGLYTNEKSNFKRKYSLKDLLIKYTELLIEYYKLIGELK